VPDQDVSASGRRQGGPVRAHWTARAVRPEQQGAVGPARELVHGSATAVRHDGAGVYRGLPQPFEAGRYHSLAATRIPEALEVTATSPDGEVMGVRHRTLPVEGVQFHPESVLTPLGSEIAKNFLEGAR